MKQKLKRPLDPEGLSGYPEDSEIDRKEKSETRENGHRKIPKATKKMGLFPSGVANFVIG
jgi:hypothetical protein